MKLRWFPNTQKSKKLKPPGAWPLWFIRTWGFAQNGIGNRTNFEADFRDFNPGFPLLHTNFEVPSPATLAQPPQLSHSSPASPVFSAAPALCQVFQMHECQFFRRRMLTA